MSSPKLHSRSLWTLFLKLFGVAQPYVTNGRYEMTKIVHGKYAVMLLLHKIQDFNTPLNQFKIKGEVCLSLTKMCGGYKQRLNQYK